MGLVVRILVRVDTMDIVVSYYILQCKGRIQSDPLPLKINKILFAFLDKLDILHVTHILHTTQKSLQIYLTRFSNQRKSNNIYNYNHT